MQSSIILYSLDNHDIESVQIIDSNDHSDKVTSPSSCKACAIKMRNKHNGALLIDTKLKNRTNYPI